MCFKCMPTALHIYVCSCCILLYLPWVAVDPLAVDPLAVDPLALDPLAIRLVFMGAQHYTESDMRNIYPQYRE